MHTSINPPTISSTTTGLNLNQELHPIVAGMEHSTPLIPQTISFLELPAELRLQIYKYAIPAMPYDLPYQNAPVTAPTALVIRNIAGFIMSCRQIYREVEDEAIECINDYLTSARFIQWRDTGNSYAIGFPTPIRFSDTISLRFDVSGLYENFFVFGEVIRSADGLGFEMSLIGLLLNTFVSFTLDAGPYQIVAVRGLGNRDPCREFSDGFDAVVLDESSVMYARAGYLKPIVPA